MRLTMDLAAWVQARAGWLASAYQQVRSSARLRIGLAIVLAVLWTEGVLLSQDAVTALRAEATQLGTQLNDSRALARQRFWPERVQAASTQLQTVRALMWSEPEQGLAEARMQDWVGTLAVKSGLTVREIALLRQDATVRVAASSSAGTSAEALPAGYARVRLKLSAEFNPSAMSVMLAEMAQAETMVKVERLQIRTTTNPPLLDLELSSVARLVDAAGSGAR